MADAADDRRKALNLAIAQIDLVSSSAPVPEIDPNSLGNALALLVGSLGVVERRNRRLRRA